MHKGECHIAVCVCIGLSHILQDLIIYIIIEQSAQLIGVRRTDIYGQLRRQAKQVVVRQMHLR